ncbi:MAG: hypothetical protein M3298_02465 [Thermoproteota archaeon]|jgi:cytoskeletal protein RodZ|nr:hypothetical protein [Thermoproteota archaeon]
MSENKERKFYRGSARWIIIGIIAALAVVFVIVVAFGSTLFPSGPRTGGMQSETADQSATSGPGHNTTTSTTTTSESEPLEGQQDAATVSTANTTGAGQIPDAGVTFGRETSTQNTPIPGQQQGLNNNTITNGTGAGGGGLENPLSENITSLTGTSS